MYTIYSDTSKNAIFWSAKTGCSVIKHIVYNVIEKRNIKNVHIKESYGLFDKNKLDFYTKILICRNPYIRIVSAYLDKLKFFKEYENFNHFIHHYDIYKNHHTALQFSEGFDLIVQHNYNLFFDKIYDIDNLNIKEFLAINFKYRLSTEELDIFKYPIVSPVKNRTRIYNAEFMSSIELESYKTQYNNIPHYSSFLSSQTVRDKILELYSIDFQNLAKLGFNYYSSYD